MKHLFSKDYTINGGSRFVWKMIDREVSRLFLYTRIWPFLRMWRPLTLATCWACLNLLISSSTLQDASPRFAHSPAVSPIWWQRSSIQAMPALKLAKESWTLSSPCTLPFSAACCSYERPVALASFLTLASAIVPRSWWVSSEASLKRPITMPIS